jgi:hypothetical protein
VSRWCSYLFELCCVSLFAFHFGKTPAANLFPSTYPALSAICITFFLNTHASLSALFCFYIAVLQGFEVDLADKIEKCREAYSAPTNIYRSESPTDFFTNTPLPIHTHLALNTPIFALHYHLDTLHRTFEPPRDKFVFSLQYSLLHHANTRSQHDHSTRFKAAAYTLDLQHLVRQSSFGRPRELLG